jgi:pimeloyl-ACP methyl ester carboxylesterase
MDSLFKSASGKKEILDLYDQKLEELNISCDSIYLETSFGRTHVLRTGSPTSPPLILVHGSNGCAPIALECYPNLSSKYQVFAVDVLAQPNKSAETRLSMKNESYGEWVNEIITELDIDNVTLAGFSFGGLIILKTLVYKQDSIKAAFIASPAYIVNGNPLSALFKIFIPIRRYMKSHKMKFVEKFLSVLFTERDEFAVNFLGKVFLHFKMEFTPVPLIKREEAQRITTPITILAAKKDVIFPGPKMKKRAGKLFSSLKGFLLLEDSKHVQDRKGNLIFEELILESENSTTLT